MTTAPERGPTSRGPASRGPTAWPGLADRGERRPRLGSRSGPHRPDHLAGPIRPARPRPPVPGRRHEQDEPGERGEDRRHDREAATAHVHGTHPDRGRPIRGEHRAVEVARDEGRPCRRDPGLRIRARRARCARGASDRRAGSRWPPPAGRWRPARPPARSRQPPARRRPRRPCAASAGAGRRSRRRPSGARDARRGRSGSGRSAPPPGRTASGRGRPGSSAAGPSRRPPGRGCDTRPGPSCADRGAARPPAGRPRCATVRSGPCRSASR